MAKSGDEQPGDATADTQEGINWALDETAPRQVGNAQSLAPPAMHSSAASTAKKEPITHKESADRADASVDEDDTASVSGILGQIYEDQESLKISVPSVGATGQVPVVNWDRYELLGLLGRGGMGSVYKATDRRLGRTVAIKFVRGDDERLTLRFLQEAKSQARIQHPGICQVLEVGEVEGKPYIAMQFVDGQSLAQAKDQLSEDEKVQVIKESAEALHAAHQLGIIHRDRTPPSIPSRTEYRTELGKGCEKSRRPSAIRVQSSRSF